MALFDGPIELTPRARAIDRILRAALQSGASQVLLTPGKPIQFRVQANWTDANEEQMPAAAIRAIVDELMNEAKWAALREEGDVEIEVVVPPLETCRATVSRAAEHEFLVVTLPGAAIVPANPLPPPQPESVSAATLLPSEEEQLDHAISIARMEAREAAARLRVNATVSKCLAAEEALCRSVEGWAGTRRGRELARELLVVLRKLTSRAVEIRHPPPDDMPPAEETHFPVVAAPTPAMIAVREVGSVLALLVALPKAKPEVELCARGMKLAHALFGYLAGHPDDEHGAGSRATLPKDPPELPGKASKQLPPN